MKGNRANGMIQTFAILYGYTPRRAPMSVTFTIDGDTDDLYEEGRFVNLTSINARVFLEALGVNGGTELRGSLPAAVLAQLCMRIVNSPTEDPGEPVKVPLRSVDNPNAHLVLCGRRPGHTHATARMLWDLALKAPTGSRISWS